MQRLDPFSATVNSVTRGQLSCSLQWRTITRACGHLIQSYSALEVTDSTQSMQRYCSNIIKGRIIIFYNRKLHMQWQNDWLKGSVKSHSHDSTIERFVTFWCQRHDDAITCIGEFTDCGWPHERVDYVNASPHRAHKQSFAVTWTAIRCECRSPMIRYNQKSYVTHISA